MYLMLELNLSFNSISYRNAIRPRHYELDPLARILQIFLSPSCFNKRMKNFILLSSYPRPQKTSPR